MGNLDQLPYDLHPNVYVPKFDIESLNRYPDVIKDGEEVVVTEKIHGCLLHSARISMADGTRRQISKVDIGDMVLGQDSNGKIVPTKVVNVFRNGISGKG